ncbi:MAG: hypothetical protein R3A79_25605 [Nannocystaceae bacterium]
MRRLSMTLGLSLSTLLVGAALAAPQVAEAHKPHHVEPVYTPPAVGRDVSVSVESAGGYGLASYWHGGERYVEGRAGERYSIRLTNNTGGRVEAVVTVDGRDVVSGELGDYRGQRGYVLGPYESVTIEGYRQSLDYVAAFRFADIHHSYSALRGTPQHVGVIGVAVFEEAGRRRVAARPQPVQPRPYPRYYEPYGGADEAPAAPSAEASADYDYGYGGATTSAPGRASKRSSGSYAPAPSRPSHLGTQYGESTYSSVRETTFKRKNKRRPDSITKIYYDSHEGLRARGVPVDPPHYHYAPPPPSPEPFPQVGYAPPPPRRY